MFYIPTILGKKGPLAKLWLAAHDGRRLTRAQIMEVDIPGAIALFDENTNLYASLRIQGDLLVGISYINKRQTEYLMEMASKTIRQISSLLPLANLEKVHSTTGMGTIAKDGGVREAVAVAALTTTIEPVFDFAEIQRDFDDLRDQYGNGVFAANDDVSAEELARRRRNVTLEDISVPTVDRYDANHTDEMAATIDQEDGGGQKVVDRYEANHTDDMAATIDQENGGGQKVLDRYDANHTDDMAATIHQKDGGGQKVVDRTPKKVRVRRRTALMPAANRRLIIDLVTRIPEDVFRAQINSATFQLAADFPAIADVRYPNWDKLFKVPSRPIAARPLRILYNSITALGAAASAPPPNDDDDFFAQPVPPLPTSPVLEKFPAEMQMTTDQTENVNMEENFSDQYLEMTTIDGPRHRTITDEHADLEAVISSQATLSLAAMNSTDRVPFNQFISKNKNRRAVALMFMNLLGRHDQKRAFLEQEPSYYTFNTLYVHRP